MVHYSRPPRSRGRLIRGLRGLNDHWVGDVIGALCLAVTVVLGVIAAGVLS